MLPLEAAIAAQLKALGLRKKARTWWHFAEETIGVLNIQKSPYGERLYINLGAYLRPLGMEAQPPAHRCHVGVRLEQVARKAFWNEIAAAEATAPPSTTLVEAILVDGVDWLRRVSTLDGVRKFIDSDNGKKAMVYASVHELLRDNAPQIFAGNDSFVREKRDTHSGRQN